MSRDMMRSFELYQPDTVEGAIELLGTFRRRRLGARRRQRQPRLVQGPRQAPRSTSSTLPASPRSRASARPPTAASRSARSRRSPKSSAATCSGALQGCCADAARARREPADPQRRHARRQRLPGRALLVLPLRRGLLPRRRQHAATRTRPKGQNREHCLFGAARCVAVSPVRYGARARRARREDGDRRPRRASARCRPRSSSSARTSTSRA